ncbi:MAG: hypothetical protein WD072_06140 [Pirellulales bacterium]
MIPKLLAWFTLATAILFAILALTAIFGFGREPPTAETARLIVVWGAVPLLGISLLLVVALLVVSAFTTDSDS